MTKSTRAVLEEVIRQGGDVTCSSFARAMGYGERAARTGANVLARARTLGYLARWAEYVGSATVIHYALTPYGEKALADKPPEDQVLD